MIEDERFVLDLVQDHKIKLMKIITSRLGQCRTADVEDCFQDIFMLAFINREKLKTHPNPVGWLYVTASNVAYRFPHGLRNQRLTVSFSDVMEYLGEDGVDIAELHSEALEDTEDNRKKRVLDELCDKEKELYRLKYVEKKDNRYLAEYYSTTEGCIRARLSQLRKHVRKIVEKQMK